MKYYLIASDRVHEIKANIECGHDLEDTLRWFDENSRDDSYKKMFQKYGLLAQKTACIEECSELITALSKSMNGKKGGESSSVLSEMADVYILIEQLTMDNKELFMDTIKEKHEKMLKYL